MMILKIPSKCGTPGAIERAGGAEGHDYLAMRFCCQSAYSALKEERKAAALELDPAGLPELSFQMTSSSKSSFFFIL